MGKLGIYFGWWVRSPASITLVNYLMSASVKGQFYIVSRVWYKTVLLAFSPRTCFLSLWTANLLYDFPVQWGKAVLTVSACCGGQIKPLSYVIIIRGTVLTIGSPSRKGAASPRRNTQIFPVGEITWPFPQISWMSLCLFVWHRLVRRFYHTFWEALQVKLMLTIMGPSCPADASFFSHAKKNDRRAVDNCLHS